MVPIIYNKEKFKELVLYIARACDEDPYFGAIKLNKILFYSDFTAYARWGTSITGAIYRKLEHGPAPAYMKGVKSELEASNEAYERIVVLSDTCRQKRLLTGRDADTSIFSSEELAIVDEYIEALWGMTATQVSDESHRFPGWKRACMLETIPYQTVFLQERQPPMSDKDMEWAKHRVAEYQADLK